MSSSPGPSKGPPQPAYQTAEPSSNFKSMLDAALIKYKKKTGEDLQAIWLASELQSCESVDSVLDILRNQANALDRSGDRKVINWIDPLVHVLFTFSDALGDGVSLVCIMTKENRLRINVHIPCEGVPSCESDLYGNRCLARRPCSRPTFSRTASV